jgi:hypothetical protein
VCALPANAELPLQHRGAGARVYYPATPDLSRFARALDIKRMCITAWANGRAADSTLIKNKNTLVSKDRHQVAFQFATVNLVANGRQ